MFAYYINDSKIHEIYGIIENPLCKIFLLQILVAQTMQLDPSDREVRKWEADGEPGPVPQESSAPGLCLPTIASMTFIAHPFF